MERDRRFRLGGDPHLGSPMPPTLDVKKVLCPSNNVCSSFPKSRKSLAAGLHDDAEFWIEVRGIPRSRRHDHLAASDKESQAPLLGQGKRTQLPDNQDCPFGSPLLRNIMPLVGKLAEPLRPRSTDRPGKRKTSGSCFSNKHDRDVGPGDAFCRSTNPEHGGALSEGRSAVAAENSAIERHARSGPRTGSP